MGGTCVYISKRNIRENSDQSPNKNKNVIKVSHAKKEEQNKKPNIIIPLLYD